MSRYSLRQTPRKKELFEGMVETPTASRRSSRRQSSFPPELLSDADNDSSSAGDVSTRTRSLRRRTAKFTESLNEEEEETKPQTNGKSAHGEEVVSNGSPKKSTPKSTPKKPAAPKSADAGVVDGWRKGQDPKVDYSGEFEFGGSVGTLAMMILFPVLMWYMWIGATYYDGKFPSRAPGQSWASFGAQLVNYVYTGAFPHVKAWFWYWSYLIFQGACYCLLPGVWGWGKPLPHEGGKQLKYYCNAFATLYFTLAILAILHFTGIWPLYNAIDEFGPLLSVAILSGFLVSFAAYFSALYRGKEHRMTGYPIYDFFMGAELNPRMFGILDFKMFCEVRMPWYFLLILSLGTAARQWERYGYVSGEVMFLVMAHYLYANACAKGEELIITTWDMYYEKWGFMLIFWNLAGVPLSYCHCTIYLANHNPSEYHWNRWFLAFVYIAYLFWYWVWDSCNSQKNRFRAMERGKMVARKTFPQVPWQTIQNPKTIETPQGTILVDGWYGLARKIHYTADAWFAISWGLITGFKSPFPWFYPVFFCCMIAHRAARDIHRCRNKYGEHWLEYERQVPYLFIPYVI
ncbi:ergosterol biosynthesis ERG4/ERG24 family protein [Metarhizium robertsii]|uniref:Delta(24(24(1)))-sterol reductase n=2 Tax=Metarhizium robertsii TaxID=568076 RepID=E9EZY6_METRA|nr:Delta(24(24(1)))-sterol reductase [Metarhizium robertsii ARSEF 23]EFY98446.1 Delta(24(24(1)))-sterol reductase [Metarhizium robertsii ARSEF 23]EXV04425.1 ergosterol biosynthesis ERG4/ERG24 family protein [Metarhizium robertsii]